MPDEKPLKPCPICGEGPPETVYYEYPDSPIKVGLSCACCGARFGAFVDGVGLKEAWNALPRKDEFEQMKRERDEAREKYAQALQRLNDIADMAREAICQKKD